MSGERYRDRTYRELVATGGRTAFQVTVKETDLHIQADRELKTEARDLILTHRGYVENYIRHHPEFTTQLTPWRLGGPAPEIIRLMVAGSTKAGVGPMAAVAGAVAEQVGRGLLPHTREVIVENGGDLFIKANAPQTVALFAGRSVLSMRVGMKIDAVERPVGVCTSSGTVGHSLSMGDADAVCVVSDDCALADAAATAIGNHVKGAASIDAAIDWGRRIDGVRGIVIVVKERIGMWGEIEVVPLVQRGLNS